MQGYNYKQGIKFLSLSFITLFTLWMILSGYSEPFFILCGLFSSAFTLFIFTRLINAASSLSRIVKSEKKLSFRELVSYIPWLMYQIILSSIYVTRKVLQLNPQLEPVIILRKCKGHNEESITLFANSVTITPGTLMISVEKEQQTYFATICLIDKNLESGISEIENRVLSNRSQ